MRPHPVGAAVGPSRSPPRPVPSALTWLVASAPGSLSLFVAGGPLATGHGYRADLCGLPPWRAKIYTGAYLITGGGVAGKGKPKHPRICANITASRKLAEQLVDVIRADRSVEIATKWIAANLPGCGMFNAYEVASDLRWSKLLIDAHVLIHGQTRVPGAKRGWHGFTGGPALRTITCLRRWSGCTCAKCTNSSKSRVNLGGSESISHGNWKCAISNIRYANFRNI